MLEKKLGYTLRSWIGSALAFGIYVPIVLANESYQHIHEVNHQAQVMQTDLEQRLAINEAERVRYLTVLLNNSSNDVSPLIIAILESDINQFDEYGNILTSNSGAKGLMQLTQGAIRDLNFSTGKKSNRILLRYERGKPIYVGVLEGTYSWTQIQKDGIKNIEAGIAYLQLLDKKFSDFEMNVRRELIIAAYIAGPTQIRKAINLATKQGISIRSFDDITPYLREKAKKDAIPYMQRFREWFEELKPQEKVYP